MDIEQYMDFQRVQQYISHMRPMFDKRALFSDETRQYRIPEELEAGDTVSITFAGGIQESSPAVIEHVVRIQLLDDAK